jgi:hypothetical protein
MTPYNSLGLNIFKYNQAGLFGFSLLIIGLNYLLGSPLYFWFILFGMLIILNLLWYFFSVIEWNSESFLIKKFLKKKVIALCEFIKVERLFLNVFVIIFTGNKFYYVGGYESIFENSSAITSQIIAVCLKKPQPHEIMIECKWEFLNDKMLANDACKRIDWLIHHYLQKVNVIDEGWTINYIDPEDGRYWQLTYPHGEMQGGGPPMLECIPV